MGSSRERGEIYVFYNNIWATELLPPLTSYTTDWFCPDDGFSYTIVAGYLFLNAAVWFPAWITYNEVEQIKGKFAGQCIWKPDPRRTLRCVYGDVITCHSENLFAFDIQATNLLMMFKEPL